MLLTVYDNMAELNIAGLVRWNVGMLECWNVGLHACPSCDPRLVLRDGQASLICKHRCSLAMSRRLCDES